MFAKRIKSVRDTARDIKILNKRIKRDVSKLNQNIQTQIKKKFHRIGPGLQIKTRKIYLEDFLKNEKQGTPLLVKIFSVNGKKIHTDGTWLERDDESNYFFATENKISVEKLQEICYELSEELGINLQIEKIQEIYLKDE